MISRAFFQRVLNPAVLEERRQLFLDNDLAISRNTKHMKSFGTYPVLYVNLSVSELIYQSPIDADSRRKIRGETFEDLHVAFQKRVKAVAEDLQKQGLLSRVALDELDRTFLTQVMSRTLPADEWPEALSKLMTILHTIHNRDVIVLIDEYDTPAAHASEHGYFSAVCLHQPSLISIS